RLQIPPTLKRPERPWLGQDQFRLEHQPTAADAVLVPERPHIDEALAAQNLATDHPIERAAVSQLTGALGRHPGDVPMLERQLAPLLLVELFANPAAQILYAVAADAELDQV